MEKQFRRWETGQRLLLPPSVDEFVPEDHPARLVRDARLRPRAPRAAARRRRGPPHESGHSGKSGWPVAIEIVEEYASTTYMSASMAATAAHNTTSTPYGDAPTSNCGEEKMYVPNRETGE